MEELISLIASFFTPTIQPNFLFFYIFKQNIIYI